MFFAVGSDTEIIYKSNNRTVVATAVCLMEWVDADGFFTGEHRLMVVHDDRDPVWLNVIETPIYNANGVQIAVWSLLNDDDRRTYQYHKRKHHIGTKRAFWTTLGRELKAKAHE